MEVNVYNIKGEDTGRKVTLNESIFGIEPNDHAIYLDVKLTSLRKEAKSAVPRARSVVRRAAAAHVVVI